MYYGERGEYDLAIQNYDKAIEIDPNYMDAYINCGNAYGAKGDFEHALADLNKAAELSPADVYIYYN